jgi:DNA-binding NtrC family response regulator
MAHILLIEDDPLFRSILRETLAHFGHTIVEARNGEEGLKLFEKSSADLVITDLVMPEIEGFEVLMKLQRQDPLVKVIVMSGGGSGVATDYLEIATRLGAARVLAKPFSHHALLAAVNELSPTVPVSAEEGTMDKLPEC